MASNTRSVPDITDFEDYPDWIELHNAGADAISLDGYFLSDNPNSPFNPLSPHLRFLQRRPKPSTSKANS